MTLPQETVQPVFDREAALLRVGGDMDLLREIGALFLEESAPAISDLRTAVSARDPVNIERRAHGLKGSISTFGSGAAFQAALELEQQGRRHDLADVELSMQRFETSLASLCSELQQFLGG